MPDPPLPNNLWDASGHSPAGFWRWTDQYGRVHHYPGVIPPGSQPLLQHPSQHQLGPATQSYGTSSYYPGSTPINASGQNAHGSATSTGPYIHPSHPALPENWGRARTSSPALHPSVFVQQYLSHRGATPVYSTMPQQPLNNTPEYAPQVTPGYPAIQYQIHLGQTTYVSPDILPENQASIQTPGWSPHSHYVSQLRPDPHAGWYAPVQVPPDTSPTFQSQPSPGETRLAITPLAQADQQNTPDDPPPAYSIQPQGGSSTPFLRPNTPRRNHTLRTPDQTAPPPSLPPLAIHTANTTSSTRCPAPPTNTSTAPANRGTWRMEYRGQPPYWTGPGDPPLPSFTPPVNPGYVPPEPTYPWESEEMAGWPARMASGTGGRWVRVENGAGPGIDAWRARPADQPAEDPGL